MRRLILFALLAYATGSLLVYVFGDSGVTAFGRLERYRDRLEQNVRDLDVLNRSLQEELKSLRDNPQRMEVLARDLGLYRPDERVLRIEGSSAQVEPYDVGTLLRLKPPRHDRGPWLKTAGLCVAALAGLVTYLIDRRGRRPLHGARRR
jgi:cell division protein FtsB